MITRKFRLKRGWSQDQLAQLSGLSVRTIQRIERGQTASLESLKSLAAVFEVNVCQLQEDSTMTNSNALNKSEQSTIEYVRDIKGFYTHILIYFLVVIPLSIASLSAANPTLWALWPWAWWGLGVVIHGLSVFEVFNILGPKWEKKQIEKRLGKKL